MLEKNCVALLQEFCQKNKYELPLYEELKCERSGGNSTVFKYKVLIRLPQKSYEATGTFI